MLIPLEFVNIIADNENAPLMLLKEESGSRTIHISVNGYDANRLALVAFQKAINSTKDLITSLLDALEGTLEKIILEHQDKQVITCKLVFRQNKKLITLEARPGEAIALALSHEAPIYAHEKLFFAQRDTISLKERLRAMSTTDFGHALLS